MGEVETLENTFLQHSPKWNHFTAIFCLEFAGKDYRGEEVMTNCPFGQRSLWMTLQLWVCDTTSQNSPLRWAKITHKSPSRALQKTLFFYVCFAEKNNPVSNWSHVISSCLFYYGITLNLKSTECQDFTVITNTTCRPLRLVCWQCSLHVTHQSHHIWGTCVITYSLINIMWQETKHTHPGRYTSHMMHKPTCWRIFYA